jgi:hypothetical protein
LSAISVSGRFFTRRCNFLKKRASRITARLPDIGSASCYTIFQVSD